MSLDEILDLCLELLHKSDILSSKLGLKSEAEKLPKYKLVCCLKLKT